jgi:hypothetical protein
MVGTGLLGGMVNWVGQPETRHYHTGLMLSSDGGHRGCQASVYRIIVGVRSGLAQGRQERRLLSVSMVCAAI